MESDVTRDLSLRTGVFRGGGVAALSALLILLAAAPATAAKGGNGPPRDPKPSRCVKPPPMLVAWWPFDESAGPVAAEIEQGIDGIYQGSPTPAPGKVFRALLFGGFNGTGGDFVEAPDHPDLDFGTNDFSIDVWIKTSLATGIEYIVNKVTCGIADAPFGYSLFLDNGYLGFSMNADTANNFTSMGLTCASGVQSCAPVADGKWHLVAVTVDRSQSNGGRLWVDAAVQATFTPTTMVGTADNSATFLIGTRQQCRGPARMEYFAGYMDELEVFHRELKQLAMTKIFKADCAGKCKPCEDRPPNGLPEGSVCNPSTDVCACGLQCCYPCGIPGCQFRCIPPDPQTTECPLFP